MGKLPIEQVQSANGVPSFKWRQRVTSPIGVTWVEYQGPLPSTVEQAVVKLIKIAQEQSAVIAKLTKENEELRQSVEVRDGQTTQYIPI